MNPEEKKPIKALRTYAGDVEEALSKTKSSAATIMIAEEKRREEKPELAPVRRSQATETNRLFLVLGTLMLFLAVSVIGGVYYLKSNEKVEIKSQANALLTFSKEAKVVATNSTRDTLLQKIVFEKDGFNMPANSILYINTADKDGASVPATDVLTTLSKRIPADLARSFDGKYMFGVLSYDTNAMFLILKTSDYPIAYSGMLKWETDLINDMGRIFSIPQNLVGSEDAHFIDEEYKNKDLRVLRDSNNKPVLLYTFIDRNTIIITINEDILSAILNKYSVSQEVR